MVLRSKSRNTGRPGQRGGFSLIELLMVIAIITFLIAALFAVVGRLRERARYKQTNNLLEKLHNNLETYRLHFRIYPPGDFAGMTGSRALYYFLSTPFRVKPDSSKGEIAASTDVGPLATFNEGEVLNGQIMDLWGQPLHYSTELLDDRNQALKANLNNGLPQTLRGEQRVLTVDLYSFGPNRTDDAGGGDDIRVQTR